ncbi:LexA family protein [Negativicoccus succinicivorans]|uniref:LexA family protein n=1 Tax=Negativicoccus succinicivorans TaxID=620903 RepID=UPI0026F31F0F|nr:S24 family peptidase [Negativicoccus succinicivorans]
METEIRAIFSRNLKMYMESHDLNNVELSRIVGVSESTVGKWLLQKSLPRMGVVEQLANYFKINKSDLLEDKGRTVSIPDDPNVFIPKLKKVPLLGTTAAGEPILSEENFEGYVGTTTNADFCLHVSGDSMTGIGIYDGDTVFVKSQNEAESGQVVVVRINGDAVTLKRFYHNGESVILQSENPAYPPMIFNANNCDDFRILGRAIIKQSIIK